ncbi:MAG: hypothetical protein J5780_03870 [Treponema sp.]|nr:hypothetical protein [Treponema sp.]
MAVKKDTSSEKNNEAKKGRSESWDKILSFLERGFAASKKGLKNAGSAISDFGDKSVLRIENSQIKGKIEKNFAKLGEYAYNLFSSKKSSSLTAKDQTVKAIIADIDALYLQELQNKKSIKAVDEKKSSKKKTESSKRTASENKVSKGRSEALKKVPQKKTASRKTAAVKKTASRKTSSKK